MRCRAAGDILEPVVHHDEQAVRTAVELSLAERVPTKIHVLNLLHRLIDAKVTCHSGMNSDFAIKAFRLVVDDLAKLLYHDSSPEVRCSVFFR